MWTQTNGQPWLVNALCAGACFDDKAGRDLWERIVIECRVLRDSDRKSFEGTIERGVEQTLGYMKECRAKEGHLIVFDRRTAKQPSDEGEPRREAGNVALWLL